MHLPREPGLSAHGARVVSHNTRGTRPVTGEWVARSRLYLAAHGPTELKALALAIGVPVRSAETLRVVLYRCRFAPVGERIEFRRGTGYFIS